MWEYLKIVIPARFVDIAPSNTFPMKIAGQPIGLSGVVFRSFARGRARGNIRAIAMGIFTSGEKCKETEYSAEQEYFFHFFTFRYAGSQPLSDRHPDLFLPRARICQYLP